MGEAAATEVPWVFNLLALCHALSVSSIDNHPALASVNLIDLATHKYKETCEGVSSVGQGLDFNTRNGTYLHFEVAHVCMGSRSKEGRGVGSLVREGEARAPPPLLSLQAAHHHWLPHHLKVEEMNICGGGREGDDVKVRD